MDADIANAWTETDMSRGVMLHSLIVEHGEAYLNSIITGDESWLHDYDSRNKHKSADWKSPSYPMSKKAKVVCLAEEVMVISFINCNGMVYNMKCPSMQQLLCSNIKIHIGFLKTLAEHIWWKCPVQHHNKLCCPYIWPGIECKTEYVLQHPYSPDLVLSEFVVPLSKIRVAEQHFNFQWPFWRKQKRFWGQCQIMASSSSSRAGRQCVQASRGYFKKNCIKLDSV